MEFEEFKSGYRYMREANISQAMVFLGLKSDEWIETNIPCIAYDEQIYNFIKSTSACIHVTYDTMVYEVNGQWQLITQK